MNDESQAYGVDSYQCCHLKHSHKAMACLIPPGMCWPRLNCPDQKQAKVVVTIALHVYIYICARSGRDQCGSLHGRHRRMARHGAAMQQGRCQRSVATHCAQCINIAMSRPSVGGCEDHLRPAFHEISAEVDVTHTEDMLRRSVQLACALCIYERAERERMHTTDDVSAHHHA